MQMNISYICRSIPTLGDINNGFILELEIQKQIKSIHLKS